MFFEFAGGDPCEPHGAARKHALRLDLSALGASSMGALTYVGNAPNLMIYAIAVERGIAMPSFFAFTAWSAVLLPVFAIVGWGLFQLN